MYAIRIPGSVSLRTNEPLREYARLEYGSQDVLWILASARTGLTPSRRPRARAFFGRRVKSSPRPVACKGSPRRSSERVSSPG